MKNPAIVVVAFNRPKTLSRLLESLAASKYPDESIDLIVSIDHSESQQSTVDVADAFKWQHGRKRILRQLAPLGLRSHILQSGDFTEEFGSIILLEDDLYVSPYFYDYALASQNFFANDSKIAGVSLYNHGYNETAKRAFQASDDGYDNYFMQLPSSWGQVWTASQWVAFRSWYDLHSGRPITKEDGVPEDVIKWPNSSWKKYFIKYMVSQNLYFSFPRISLTTNFMDPGTHHLIKYNHLQMPLQLSQRTYLLAHFGGSRSVYDVFCEPDANLLTRDYELLRDYANDLTIDLYGSKPLNRITSKYILTCKTTAKPIVQWGRHLKPHEQNVNRDIKGGELSLCETTNCRSEMPINFFEEANYFHNLSPQLLKLGTFVPQEKSHGTSGRNHDFSASTPSVEQHLENCTNLLAARERELDSLLTSRSWKVTKPLRWLKELLNSVE